MADQPGFWDVEERLKAISAKGDPLETLSATVDFEIFRPVLKKTLKRADPSRGGRPGFDPVLKFKMLVLQTMHGLSLEQTEYLVRDRLSWMRFCGLSLGDAVPDANTLWDFREALIRAKALERVFARLDAAIDAAGYTPMGGQIVDATLVCAPKQRNRQDEKAAIKAGRIPEDWQDKPAKLRQKDRDARWTVKFAKARKKEDGTTHTDIAIPTFGYKNHVSIDRRHGIIRKHMTTDAAAHDGARLREGLVDKANLASYVWADTAYRSQENERYLADHGMTSRIHRKKPKGKPMPAHIKRGNATKSKVRAAVEHVFGRQKGGGALFIRTIGIKRAAAAMTMANLVYNMRRWCWLDGRRVPA
ncbi:IS5 family transposase [Maricaulis sp.]|uniref:IS5 family transposase n=1 Tax=Maricaulis sp. TaxID=1486257 RepID=UPI002617FD22|nr:IS5 family transposase [Maricaulis sp.]MDF1769482.1 IS5 family transposase [Maricaulis sp.]